MNKNILEERFLMLFIILFFIFLYFYRPTSQINKFEPSITVVADKKEELIIKENNITKKVNKKCTHNGCLVKYDKDKGKLICPCHASEFTLNGKVIRGPATTDLSVTNNENFENCNKMLDW